MRRRDALILGGAVATAVALPPVLRRLPSDFEFQPITGADGFRKLTGGNVSGGVDPFFGLGAEDSGATRSPEEPLCISLFGPQGWSHDAVPVAFFTDANCPYCKVLEARLTDMRDVGAPIRLIWHELPLLGPSSMRHARALLAARLLEREEIVRAALSARLLRPGPAALRDLAVETGLDPAAFATAFRSAAVDTMVANGLALGRRLGIPGTPGTVIGRTLVIGAINDADLRKLIEIERSEPQSLCS